VQKGMALYPMSQGGGSTAPNEGATKGARPRHSLGLTASADAFKKIPKKTCLLVWDLRVTSASLVVYRNNSSVRKYLRIRQYSIVRVRKGHGPIREQRWPETP